MNILFERFTVLQFVLQNSRFRAELTDYPQDTKACVGDNITLRCSTNAGRPITWQYGKHADRMTDVYIGGEGFLWPYTEKKRYKVDEDVGAGKCNLIIGGILKGDEGIYRCSEVEGESHPRQATLTVTELPISTTTETTTSDEQFVTDVREKGSSTSSPYVATGCTCEGALIAVISVACVFIACHTVWLTYLSWKCLRKPKDKEVHRSKKSSDSEGSESVSLRPSQDNPPQPNRANEGKND